MIEVSKCKSMWKKVAEQLTGDHKGDREKSGVKGHIPAYQVSRALSKRGREIL
jgi:hypothetical protein